MTASEIDKRYTSEKLGEFGFKPIGVLSLGDTTFLLQITKEGLYSLEPVDTTSQQDYFRRQTERLNQKNHYNVPGIDAVQVSYAQLNPKEQIKANWNETTGGADKPEIEIPVTDPILFNERMIELSEDLLKDLFLPKQRNKQATFFTMETADQEVVGIAIRGANPKLLLLPPAQEGSRMSTIAGLNNFLEAVYLRLLERATQTQKQVDSGIFEASLPTKGNLVFSAEATKLSLAAMHKRIYKIQALLISLRCDERLASQDPNILAFAPFLRTEVKQTGISALLGKAQKPSNLIVDGSIWTSLNEPVGTGLITTAPRANRPAQVSGPVISTPPRVEQRPVQNRQPVVESPRQMTEKQKAILLAKDIDLGLNTILTAFKNQTIDTISLKQVQEMGESLEKIAKSSEKYTSERRRGKAPATPTPTRISAPTSIINVAGIKDADIFSFMTGATTVTDYREKIDLGFVKIQSLILPLISATTSRKERLLSAVRGTSHLLRLPEMPRMITELEKIAKTADVYTAEAGFVIIATQMTYTLWARYQELKNSGLEVEIDNWANYCYTVTDRLKSISKEMTSK